MNDEREVSPAEEIAGIAALTRLPTDPEVHPEMISLMHELREAVLRINETMDDRTEPAVRFVPN